MRNRNAYGYADGSQPHYRKRRRSDRGQKIAIFKARLCKNERRSKCNRQKIRLYGNGISEARQKQPNGGRKENYIKRRNELERRIARGNRRGNQKFKNVGRIQRILG